MTILLANNGWPWLFSYDRVAFLVAVPCMLLESVIVRALSRCDFGTAFRSSALANALSAALGFLCVIPARRLFFAISESSGYVQAHFITLATFMLLSIAIEFPVLRRFKLKRPLLSCIAANVFSYLIITAFATFTQFTGQR